MLTDTARIQSQVWLNPRPRSWLLLLHQEMWVQNKNPGSSLKERTRKTERLRKAASCKEQGRRSGH